MIEQLSEQSIARVDPKTIRCPVQIRTEFDEAAHQEVQDSLRAVGMLQPVLLRRLGAELVVLDGERRIRAAIAIKLASVPAIILDDDMDAAAVVQRQLVANCVREDLSVMDKARAIRQLMQTTQSTATEIAIRIGTSTATVSKLLAILDAPADVQARVATGEIGIKAAYDATRNPADVTKPRRLQKLTALLDFGRSIVFHGIDSTMDAVIAAVEELLARLKAARKQGIEWPTFAEVLRDTAKR